MENNELTLDAAIAEQSQERIRRDKLLALQKAGHDPFEIVRFEKTHSSTEILNGFEKLEGKTVAIAGRIVLKRVMGKASFAHILDGSGKIQIYIAIDEVGEQSYSLFKDWDLGDIIGVTGFIFKTKTGEVSVHAKSVTLLAKAVKPLPDKYHGLRDVDTRFRERYVDLIVNPEVKQIFLLRSLVIKAMREFLDNEGFLEVETPILQNIPGGAEARPFITHHNSLNMKMYLRISFELYLKRLIIGGLERVYEIGRDFRNEGLSYKHNPEFTMMELYQAYTDYNGMADITERMVKYVLGKTIGKTKVEYEGHQIEFGGEWRRTTMIEAVREVTKLDFNKLTAATAEAELKKLHIELPKSKTWGTLLFSAFDQLVEKTLIQPTFVLDHPIEISPLAKKKKSDPRLTERFELFVCGREMGNAYSELNDPIDQRERFEAQERERAGGNDEAHMTDEDFLNAMSYGMPPTGGLGIGIDRLIMLIAGVHSIRECLLFPTMKPLKQAKPDSKEFKLTINKGVTRKFGNVAVGVLEAIAGPIVNWKELENYTKSILKTVPNNSAQIQKWQNIFAQMHAPVDKQSSVVFLTKVLAEKGKLFNIHPMVNLYNAISVKHGLPMGAYDAECVAGDLELRFARAGEVFVGIGGKTTEQTQEGEIVYADSQGVTCRFWNAKDSDRTKITKATTRFIIFFDGVDDFERIAAAQAEMQNVLKDFSCKNYIVKQSTSSHRVTKDIHINAAQALEILKKYTTKQNLIRHALTVSGVMKHFAKLQSEDENYWAVVGLLHDVDYELYPEEHCHKLVGILRQEGFDDDFIHTIQSHGYPEVKSTGVVPQTYMENVLAAIDQLSGLIIACALIRPEKKLEFVNLESVLKRWKMPTFAAGTNRKNIMDRCNDIGVSLDYLAAETLKAMQGFAGEIGL